MGQFLSTREKVCPKCGGWLEGFEENDEWVCDTCDYTSIEDENHIVDANKMIIENFK